MPAMGKLHIRENTGRDALLFLGGFFLLFWALGTRGLWAAEGRWAEITREMFLTKDFFHPTIGGTPYFDKPLLTYWFIGIISFVTKNLNEWTVRLPSAIAGIIAIWATRDIGTRLWSKKVGTIAAWMLLTSYGCLFWSRTGTADTENLAAIILAVAWYWRRRDKPGFLTYQIFYLIIFLGALTKGLVAVVIPVLIILPDILQEKRWRFLLKPDHFLALAIGGAVYLSPSIYSSLTRPGNYESSSLSLVFRENVIRYFKPFDHKGPVYQYLYSIPALLFPWAPIWIASTIGAIKAWKYLDDKAKWLLKAIALIFLFFTLSGSRRSYYILPILPFCTLLTAVFLVKIRQPQPNTSRDWGIDIQNGLLFVMLLLELLAPLALIFMKFKEGYEFPLKLYIAFLVTGFSALCLVLIAKKYLRYREITSRLDQVLISNIIIATVLWIGYFCWQEPILDSFRTNRSFALEVKDEIADWQPESVGFYVKNDTKVLFYLDMDRPARVLKDDNQLREFLASEHSRILISRREYESDFISEISVTFSKEPDISEEIKFWDSDSSQKRKLAAWILKKPIAKKDDF